MTTASIVSAPSIQKSRWPTLVALAARPVLVLGVSAAIVMFLCIPSDRTSKAVDTERVRHIGLSQKDAAFHVVPGGAAGDVWFDAVAPTFTFRLSASGLKPGVHYLVELYADDHAYEVTSRAADPQGRISLDTTLTRFETGACIGGDYVPPRPLRGNHTIKFLLKRDGNPASGTRRTLSRSVEPPDLPCHGNGDEDFTYTLFEDNVAKYTGSR
jgi:hypothetical protein